MAFREHLQPMVSGVEGAIVASVMGFDGISIETVEAANASAKEGLDVGTMLIEYSAILNQIRRAAEVLESGLVTEISVNTEEMVTLVRLLNQDYFVVLALSPDSNYGKARYLMRVNAPRIASEL